MTFLALIGGLLLMKLWGPLEGLQRGIWFVDFRAAVFRLGLPAGVSLLLVVALPAVAAWCLLDYLRIWVFGLFWLAAAIGLLLFSLSALDFKAMMNAYRRYAEAGDFEAVDLWLWTTLQNPQLQRGDTDNEQQRYQRAQQSLLYEDFQGWFAVVFYFVLLGPAGALAYRLLQMCRTQVPATLAERSLYYIDWVPLRLLAATFSLTGHFIAARDAFFASSSGGADTGHSSELLYAVASGSLQLSLPSGDGANFAQVAVSNNHDLQQLMSRSASAWLLIISAWVVFG